MGAVYQGARVADGKPVAIKVLAADLAAKPVARARFLNEANLAARARHPHIIDIIDTGEESERVYLVMDLLEGEDLARRLQSSGPMSVGEVIDVLVPVCNALASAHRLGVTHRDLKPSNIFLAVREGRLHPMLLDFGVATDEGAGGEGEGEPAGPGGWKGVGTPMYLAPELIADPRAAGPASDQYALGAVLYEALSGQPPYAAADLQQLLRIIAAGRPPSARERRPDIPAELDAVVLRAMSADPQLRFPSVEDLRLALLPFASSPSEQEQLRRRRPPTSPAIDLEAGTPSPFVRTLVPEHEPESGPWFVAPASSDESAGEPTTPSFERTSPEDDTGSAEDDRPLVEAHRHSVESESQQAESERPLPIEGESEQDAPPPSPPAPAFFPVAWQAVSSFAIKQRRIVLASGIALILIVSVFVLRGGRSVPKPGSAPPVVAPAQTVNAVPAVAAPAITRVEPEPPPAAEPAIIEKSAAPPAVPAPAAAPVVNDEVAPVRQPESSADPVPAETPRARPKAATRRERPVSARTEAPIPKVEKIGATKPAPAPQVRESAPVRMHNGVPLLD
jgi:serine/threonine protein kinase